MSFTLTKLVGNSALIEGRDVRGVHGSVVVDTSQWDSIKLRDVKAEAVAGIDEAIANLIAPITEAIEAAKSKTALPTLDPLLYVVESESVEHVHGQHEVLTRLNPDSVVLRAIEEGQSDRLLWVNNELVLAAAAPAVTAAETDPEDAPF